MPVKIRLQRHGKKGKPFYHIVIADARAKRDGRFIEKIGTYNPVSNPAIINLDVDAAVNWLEKGAQPTDTVRAILSYKGALMKKHLRGGVAKGAFTEEEMEAKFEAWLEERANAVEAKKQGLLKSKEENKKAALESERKVNEARAAAALKLEEEASKPEEEVTEETTTEEAKTEEVTPEENTTEASDNETKAEDAPSEEK